MENSSGDLAIKMLVSSGQTENGHWFHFSANHYVTAKIEWARDEQLQILPADVASAMIAKKWARHPNDAEIAWYEGLWASTEQAPAKSRKRKTDNDPEAVAGDDHGDEFKD